MEKQCDRCGLPIIVTDDICEDCHQELLREEEQSRKLAEENYDYEYGDYKY